MNNSTQTLSINQTSSTLYFKSDLKSFVQTDGGIVDRCNGRTEIVFKGIISASDVHICPHCGCVMHRHAISTQRIKHVPIGSSTSEICFERTRYKCSNHQCRRTLMQKAPFKADNHMITKELEVYVMSLLALGNYTLKEISRIVGLNQHTIKSIDLKRLKLMYTNDGVTLKKPEKQARFLAIDEFKLHDGHKYATHIIDLETGNVLWIAKGKKKAVVYDFIEFVGLEWMSKVEAVACDMNSDFEEAFREKCEHIDIVFDYFHIVKNFNEKVIAGVRKEEQQRLIAEGKLDEANALKHSKYLLCSNASTRKRKDEEASTGKVKHKGSPLFGTATIHSKGDNEERYQNLIKNNRKFLKIDLIKESLHDAFQQNDWRIMADRIDNVIALCNSEEDDKRFQWFSKLIINHYDGILCKAVHNITSGKIEGINNKIKRARRMSYGLPDDEYFFLKVMDLSRANTNKKAAT